MKSKQIILFLLIIISINMIQAQIIVGEQYNEQEFKSICNLTLIYQIPIKNHIIEIYGIATSVKNEFEPSKLFVLKDLKEKILDGIGVYFPDKNYLKPVAINQISVCISGQFLESPTRKFIFADEDSTQFKLFARENWVASAIIVENAILYSTEFLNDTIIRINSKNGEKFSYVGYFPNVDLYPTDDNYLAFFEYENKTYVLTESEIVQTEKKYEKKQLYNFNNFYVLQ